MADTEAGKRLLDYLGQEVGLVREAEWLTDTVDAIEAEARVTLLADLRAGVEGHDWYESTLDALCDSDNGNNPFYRDDDDTLALATEVSDVLRAAILDLIRKAGER